MLSHEEPIEFLNLAVVVEQLCEVRLLPTFLDVMVVSHEVLCQEDARVEALANFWIDIGCVAHSVTFFAHQ